MSFRILKDAGTVTNDLSEKSAKEEREQRQYKDRVTSRQSSGQDVQVPFVPTVLRRVACAGSNAAAWFDVLCRGVKGFRTHTPFFVVQTSVLVASLVAPAQR